MNNTITLYTLSWNNYWDKHGAQWSSYVNNFTTKPNEIIIVSDIPVNTACLNNPNVKNIVVPLQNNIKPVAYYRNIAIENSTSDWIVPSDIDDIPLQNYLDGLDPELDISGFSFIDQTVGRMYRPDSESLTDRLYDISDLSLIPGTSALKRSIFDKIKYEDNCFEDLVFYSTASKLNLKVSNNNPEVPRFIYTGFHPGNNAREVKRVSKIYSKVLTGNRNLYCFWFSGRLTENRKKSLDILKESCGVNLILINNETFYEFQNQEIPIHSGFQYLSDVHKSDYARAYMMYFYGEGYTDIKANQFDWNPYFDELFTSKHDAVAAKTMNFYDAGNFWKEDTTAQASIMQNYSKLIGMGHFIFKPKTYLAYKWLMNIHSVIDSKYDQLVNNPSMHPYSVAGGIHSSYRQPVDQSLINPQYPFEWAEVGGIQLHKAQYELGLKDLILTMPQPIMKDYR